MELQGCYKLEFMCIDIAVSRSWCSVCPPHCSPCFTLIRVSVCVIFRETKSRNALNEFTIMSHKIICTNNIIIYVPRKIGGKEQNC